MTQKMNIKRVVPEAAYRPDVDGLRSVAVIAVLLFHGFPKLFPGGFVGVDVFFVISGFLITGIISRGVESGSFTFGGFYRRRIRRIFPALSLVLACCLIAGWVLLTSADLAQLGKHTAGAAAFSANFFYWAESGYFDTTAAAKPLLHLWSLGIEEQFYLLWPLFIVTTQRRGKSLAAVLAVIALSFLACLLTTAPPSSAAFYSPASRMWELALGGVLALTVARNRNGKDGKEPANRIGKRSWPAELGSVAGFALIVAAVWAFDSTTPYPGWRALLPTLGAGLVIAAGASTFVNRRLLSHPVMVFIGLISYPLYLWHWPLLSFAHILGLGIVPPLLTAGLLAGSVVLAAGTYLLIESPLHRTSASWRLAVGLASIMVCVGLAGGAVYRHGERTVMARPATVMPDLRPRIAQDAAATRPLAPADTAANSPAGPVAPPHPEDRRESDVAHKSATGVAPKALPPVVPRVRCDTINGVPKPCEWILDAPESAAAAGTAAPSPLALYRKHIAEAAPVSGDPSPYLNGIGDTRNTAVRAGVCEVQQASTEERVLKDAPICGKFIPGATNILLVGDSIASDTYAWMHIAYPEYNLIQKTGVGCNLQRYAANGNPQPCAWVMNSALAIALSPTEKLDAVVLGNLWNLGYISAEPLIDKLLARGLKVVVIGPSVGFTVPPHQLIEKCPSSSKDGLTIEELTHCVQEHANVYREINTALKQYAQKKGIPYVDVHELACNDSECPVLDEDGQYMFTDVWHRSLPGDVWIARRVRRNRVFERILGAR
jgi:peptidoglycan/LPS O-acetylase OafA/YrhL